MIYVYMSIYEYLFSLSSIASIIYCVFNEDVQIKSFCLFVYLFVCLLWFSGREFRQLQQWSLLHIQLSAALLYRVLQMQRMRTVLSRACTEVLYEGSGRGWWYHDKCLRCVFELAGSVERYIYSGEIVIHIYGYSAYLTYSCLLSPDHCVYVDSTRCIWLVYNINNSVRIFM
jgi:hypothetical protein